MGKTSETKFFRNLDEYSARASERRNRIEIGEKVFTLESLIHEVNEIEVSILLNNFLSIGNIIVSINGDRNYLSHFLSPHGENSLINKSLYKYREIPIKETPLLK